MDTVGSTFMNGLVTRENTTLGVREMESNLCYTVKENYKLNFCFVYIIAKTSKWNAGKGTN